MIVDHKKKFIFISVARTGCTSIRQFLGGNQTEVPEVYHATIQNVNSSNFRKRIKCSMSNSDLNIDDYFKFAFVRNPWDRLVSSYYEFRSKYHSTWNQEMRLMLSFKKFVRALPDMKIKSDIHFIPQFDCLSINGELKMDYVGRYENYIEDFKTVCKSINVKYLPSSSIGGLPHKRKTSDRRNHYKFYYEKNPELIDIVAEIYKKDIEAFDYSF